MKTHSIQILCVLALSLTACLASTPATPNPGGGGDTSGTLSASFSNPTGIPSLTLTAFTATAAAGKPGTVDATVIAGKQGNRLLTLSFAPSVKANANFTCTTTTSCGIALVENGVSAASTTVALTITLSGGKLNVSGTATFKQTTGATFDAQLTSSVPYTP
jgi:hypothetical protein